MTGVKVVLHRRGHIGRRYTSGSIPCPQHLAAGTTALDFRLRVTPGQDLSLNEIRGQRVILSFYPADWSPVCGDQITLYNQVRSDFQKYGPRSSAFRSTARGVTRRMRSTTTSTSRSSPIFIRKGAAAQRYGAYREQDGVCERALFVIDRKGMIFWSYLSPIAVNPGADGILDALENLETQEK